MHERISRIIAMEWEMFHSTQNIGGPASCQSDRPQFEIMRKSQFLVWTDAILQSYEQDLLQAIENKQNLVSFKYAYMMESTSPAEFYAIQAQLPAVSEEKKRLIDTLSRQTVLWAEAFASKYPLLARLGRPIHSYEDGPYGVSMETYSRGEWMTYSEATLSLLAAHYAQLAAEGRSVHEETLTQELALSGWGTPEQAERRLAEHAQKRM